MVLSGGEVKYLSDRLRIRSRSIRFSFSPNKRTCLDFTHNKTIIMIIFLGYV